MKPAERVVMTDAFICSHGGFGEALEALGFNPADYWCEHLAGGEPYGWTKDYYGNALAYVLTPKWDLCGRPGCARE